MFRDTFLESRVVDFVNAAELTEKDLDDSADQVFYAMQEAYDLARDSIKPQPDGSFSMSDRRLKDLAFPLLPTDGANRQYVDDQYGINSALRNGITADKAASSASATAAASAAANADAKSQLANTYAQGALESRTLATEHMLAAESAKELVLEKTDIVLTKADQVEATKTVVLSKVSDAETFKIQAENSKNAALNHELKARKWAEEAPGVQVDPSLYSAKHHAVRAAEWSEKAVDSPVSPGSYSALHHATKAQGLRNVVQTLHDTVVTEATRVEQDALTATDARNQAVQAANNAALSEANADNDRFDAQAAAADALVQKQAAQAAATAAAGYESAAAISASLASDAETAAVAANATAQTAATTATTKASEATTARNAAVAAKDAAVSAQVTVAADKDVTVAAKDLAVASANAAGASESSASSSASASASSASSASNSAAEALASKNTARSWAVGTGEIEPGLKSAKAYADEARAITSGAKTYVGQWNASGGALPITSPGTGDAGKYWIINTAGTLPGVGFVDVGWELSINDAFAYESANLLPPNLVSSVNGKAGPDVVLSSTDVPDIASIYQRKDGYTASDVLTKIKTVDGAGSGLDADLVDGLHASAFYRANKVSTFGESVTALVDAAAGRSLLGLGTAALNASGDFFPSSGVSTFAATVLDDTTAAGMRSTLGLGTAATRAVGTASANVPDITAADARYLGKTANAVSASKWTTARTITLTGGVTGSASVDGSANVTLATVVGDDSHSHTISKVTGLQTALDSKLNATATATAATRLATARTIALGGAVTGSASFNGTTNVTITATVADNSHNHTIANVTDLQEALNSLDTRKAETKADVGLGNVDNTSDLAKPISTATQTALNGKANTSGTYSGLRAQATTKEDVGLGNIPNSTTASRTSTSTVSLLQAKAMNDHRTSGDHDGRYYTQTQVDGLLSALETNRGVPAGIIAMWSGLITNLPSGWALCDGQNGTPNLVDRFVVGAGGRWAVGDTGGSADAVVVEHTHSATTESSGSHSHSGTTASAGSHTHTLTIYAQAGIDRKDRVTGYGANGTAGTSSAPVASSGAHTHTFSTNTTGAHTHTVTVSSAGEAGTDKNLPPYYALAFIMKL